MQLVEQTHLSSPPFFVCFRVAQSLVFCVVVIDRCLSFYPFSLALVLFVLQLTPSNQPFAIFKIFLSWMNE